MKQAEKIVQDYEERLVAPFKEKFFAWVNNIPVADRPNQWRIILAELLLESRNAFAGDKAVIVYKKKVK